MCNLKFVLNLHSLKRTAGLWCNGNTTVFGAVFLGSSPSRPTSKMRNPRKHGVYGDSFFYGVVNHVVIIFSISFYGTLTLPNYSSNFVLVKKYTFLQVVGTIEIFLNDIKIAYSTLLNKLDKQILTSRDVMQMLGICENTLLKMESEGTIVIDFRISNRKRYYLKNVLGSLKKLEVKNQN